jgi:hypothetical protein
MGLNAKAEESLQASEKSSIGSKLETVYFFMNEYAHRKEMAIAEIRDFQEPVVCDGLSGCHLRYFLTLGMLPAYAFR